MKGFSKHYRPTCWPIAAYLDVLSPAQLMVGSALEAQAPCISACDNGPRMTVLYSSFLGQAAACTVLTSASAEQSP